MTSAWRNHNDYWGRFNRSIVQVKKDVPDLKVIQNVQLSGRSPKTRTLEEQAITFTDEDASRIPHPRDDAIVITLIIADYSTRRVLVDNGSSADILYYPAFQQMNLR